MAVAKVIILPRDRLAWHKQMASDRGLSHVAFRVACIIGGYFNNRTGRTFVGYDRIAADLDIDRATVHRAIQQLTLGTSKNPKGRGHLDVTSGGGRKIANEYRMILKTVAPERRNDDTETVANHDQNRRTNATTTLPSPTGKDSTEFFVIEDGSDAREWSAYLRQHGKPGTLLIVTHNGQRGAWMPSRRPPPSSREEKRSSDEGRKQCR